MPSFKYEHTGLDCYLLAEGVLRYLSTLYLDIQLIVSHQSFHVGWVCKGLFVIFGQYSIPNAYFIVFGCWRRLTILSFPPCHSRMASESRNSVRR